jgi:hypothetical protein
MTSRDVKLEALTQFASYALVDTPTFRSAVEDVLRQTRQGPYIVPDESSGSYAVPHELHRVVAASLAEAGILEAEHVSIRAAPQEVYGIRYTLHPGMEQSAFRVAGSMAID